MVVLVAAGFGGYYYFLPAKADVDVGDLRDPVGYVDISAVEAKAMMDENPRINVIDVSPFYEDGHIPGAVWYDYGDGSLDEAIPSLSKDVPYLVYCHFDGPSISGAESLGEAGLMVYRLEDHFGGWEDAGFEVEV